MTAASLIKEQAASSFETSILLVDDHDENILALKSVLGELGQKMVTANSGREALRQILTQDFAVILMDVQMPDMNGYDTAALIRARKQSQYTPILFITAFNKSDAHVSTGYSVGAIDYVFKPFQPEILKAKVSAFVELSRKTHELEEEIARRKAAEDEILRLNQDLEKRVRQRTGQLETANRNLTREVTERKRAQREASEHQHSIEALNQRLQRAMTETHHRVKNNLQIIAAMVEMFMLDDRQFISVDEAKKLGVHIQTLAAVHELLTQEAKDDGEAQFIPARVILENLIGMLQRTTGKRKINYQLDEVRLSSRQGTSLALIINELLSNALKYSAGDIEVRLSVTDNRAVLNVADEGPGFGQDFDPQQAANTGLELVQSLCEWDLRGELVYTTGENGGGCVTLTMPTAA